MEQAWVAEASSFGDDLTAPERESHLQDRNARRDDASRSSRADVRVAQDGTRRVAADEYEADLARSAGNVCDGLTHDRQGAGTIRRGRGYYDGVTTGLENGVQFRRESGSSCVGIHRDNRYPAALEIVHLRAAGRVKTANSSERASAPTAKGIEAPERRWGQQRLEQSGAAGYDDLATEGFNSAGDPGQVLPGRRIDHDNCADVLVRHPWP